MELIQEVRGQGEDRGTERDINFKKNKANKRQNELSGK